MAGNFEGIKNRRFGIEIEMTGITRCSAAKAIRDVLGGSVEHIGGSYDKYKIYDDDGGVWSIVSDASIDPYKKNGDRASDLYKVEMNSPVLDYEDIPLLQEVIRGLRKAGAITGPEYDCGTHVHIDASDFDAQKIKLMTTKLSKIEEVLRRDSGRDKNALSKLIRIQALLRPTKLSTANGIDLTAITPCRYVVIVISH